MNDGIMLDRIDNGEWGLRNEEYKWYTSSDARRDGAATERSSAPFKYYVMLSSTQYSMNIK